MSILWWTSENKLYLYKGRINNNSIQVHFSLLKYTVNIKKLLVLPHFMRGQELSTLVVILSVILSVIMGIHFKVIKLEHHVLYSHYSFSIDGKSLFLSYFCMQRSTQGIESQES